MEVKAGHVGLRRAELEGQLRRFEDDPALLGALASAYRRDGPSGPELVELRLQHRIRRVRDRRLSDDEELRTVARWTAP